MKNFDWNRFSQLMKLDLTTNKNNILHSSIGAPIVVMATLLIVAQFFDPKEPFTGSRSLQFCSMNIFLFYAFFPVSIILLCFDIFAPESKRDKQIATLMLPASNLEKYLTHLTRWCLILIAGTLTFFLADALLILYYWATDGEATSLIGYAVSKFLSQGTPFIVITLSGFYAIVAIAILFAVGVQKQYTFVSLGFVLSLFAIASSGVEYSDFIIMANGMNTIHLLVLAAVIVSIGTAILYASYRSFCHWQVATHKVFNL